MQKYFMKYIYTYKYVIEKIVPCLRFHFLDKALGQFAVGQFAVGTVRRTK